jgi:hypothetical protein
MRILEQGFCPAFSLPLELGGRSALKVSEFDRNVLF